APEGILSPLDFQRHAAPAALLARDHRDPSAIELQRGPESAAGVGLGVDVLLQFVEQDLRRVEPHLRRHVQARPMSRKSASRNCQKKYVETPILMASYRVGSTALTLAPHDWRSSSPGG